MLAAWTAILPLFVVRWLALRHCQRLPYQDQIVVQALPDVLFIVPPEPRCKFHPDEPLFETDGLPECFACNRECVEREKRKAPHGRCHKHGEPYRIHAIAEGQEFLRCFRCDPQECFPGEHPF